MTTQPCLKCGMPIDLDFAGIYRCAPCELQWFRVGTNGYINYSYKPLNRYWQYPPEGCLLVVSDKGAEI